MRDNVKEVCATCKNAVFAGKLGPDMYFCDRLLGPLCECADSSAPSHVIVAGSEVGCLDYYERDPEAFALVWRYEAEEDDNYENDLIVPPLVFWGQTGSGGYRGLPDDF